MAIAHYKKFLATFERDGRAYMLGEQLKELEAQAPPAPASAPPVLPAEPATTAAPVLPPLAVSPAPEDRPAAPTPSSL